MENDTEKIQSLVSFVRQDDFLYLLGDIILISDVLVETADEDSSCLKNSQVPCKQGRDIDIVIAM